MLPKEREVSHYQAGRLMQIQLPAMAESASFFDRLKNGSLQTASVR